MPVIQWRELPLAVRNHLFDRAREREISVRDLETLWDWAKAKPEAPKGEWFKDFGSFKLCGEGAYPKTFLLKGQVAHGKEIK